MCMCTSHMKHRIFWISSSHHVDTKIDASLRALYTEYRALLTYSQIFFDIWVGHLWHLEPLIWSKGHADVDDVMPLCVCACVCVCMCVDKNQASNMEFRVRLLNIKISRPRFHHNWYCSCGQLNYESSCGILLFPPTDDLGGASPLSGLVILSSALGWSLRYVFPFTMHFRT